MTRQTSELIVVRHGQSTWNRDHLFTGQHDSPLTGLGREQAVRLADRCRELAPEAVATSDLARARETGTIVAAALGLPPPVCLLELRERWNRTLTGMTQEQVEARYPGRMADWRDGPSTDLPGDGERFEDFRARVLYGLRAAARLAPVVLVVAHAGLFRVLGEATHSGLGAGLANTAGRRIAVTGSELTDAGDPFAAAPDLPHTGAGDL